MRPRYFAGIAVTTGAILLPLVSPALTIPGLAQGLSKAAIGGLVAACALAIAHRKERS